MNRKRIAKILNFFIAALLAGIILAWWHKGTLPSHTDIHSALLRQPIQKKTDRKEFSFVYRDERYRVKPVTGYELWGLVVGHNNINAFYDLYHTSDSVDTKDIGVIWGGNVIDDDFRKVSFWNGSWTLHYRYPSGVIFSPHEVSNNHLITDKEEIRKKIARIRVADQVHLKGLLVNYQAGSNPRGWRKTSQTRKDTGGRACEVMFVEDVEFLQKGTPVWYFLYSLFAWALTLLLIAKVVQVTAFPALPTIENPSDKLFVNRPK